MSLTRNNQRQHTDNYLPHIPGVIHAKTSLFREDRSLAGLATLAVPALAQTAPTVKWRMSTSWPKSLDTIYGSADRLCKRVAELTEGRFEIRPFAGGEIVPPAQNMEAVSNGTIECNHVLASAFIGKDTAIAFDTGLAFGLNARQHNAWMQFGGGMALVRAMYKKYGIVNHVSGNVGVQMGGFYRKEIKSVADLQGLKMRIGGIGGMVLEKLGAVPQQIPGGRTSTRRSRRAPSMPPNGSVPTTTRSSACSAWRSTTTPRAGGRAAPRSPRWSTKRPGPRCLRHTRRPSSAPARKRP